MKKKNFINKKGQLYVWKSKQNKTKVKKYG